MKRRRGRSLSEDEVAIWRHVARSVTPLPGHALPLPPEPPPVVKAQATPFEAGAKQQVLAPSSVKAKLKPPSPPPLVPIERKQMRGLRRGIDRIDAHIDLHGMRQNEAHYALMGFLHRAHANGARMVLVVTGKGSTVAMSDPFNERGVLRRLVPQWLGLAELRPLVLGYSSANREHGGEGALYVRLRRGAGRLER